MARRDMILRAAVRVFARQGFAATRVEDVAAEAGVAKGSVYLCFDSRDALLVAAFEEYAAQAQAVIQRPAAVQGTDWSGSPRWCGRWWTRSRPNPSSPGSSSTCGPPDGRARPPGWTYGPCIASTAR
ncbi:Transcriptional regulator, AcrR family [Streptomyces globisporus]|uniref:Transcriptional regulator, AcrR family n=1 Tax=Streptomyces globisporus TaxID=1908 RepID=A0ABN8UZW3_STRGL|nr:Transcriptional regulator, AcrR family [Streptomyces globisporus]